MLAFLSSFWIEVETGLAGEPPTRLQVICNVARLALPTLRLLIWRRCGKTAARLKSGAFGERTFRVAKLAPCPLNTGCGDRLPDATPHDVPQSPLKVVAIAHFAADKKQALSSTMSVDRSSFSWCAPAELRAAKSKNTRAD
jgi:hypothetical protein